MSGTHRKILIFFTKAGPALSLSHVEWMREMEGAVRRSRLPVRVSEGPEARPKVGFPTALPRGVESRCEVMEIAVEPQVTVREVLERLAGEVPDGVTLFDAVVLYDGERWSVGSVEYRVEGAADELPSAAEIARLTESEEVLVERRGRTMDLKPLLAELRRTGEEVAMKIRWTKAGTARPQDVLGALGRDAGGYRITKTRVTFQTSLGERIRKPDVA